MDTQPDNQISNVNDDSTEPLSVGKTLRAAREQMGLSVNDVANRIKFAPRQIESLEADDYERLPEAAFVRGFVRSYARLLELDPAKLIAGLPSSHAKDASTTQEIKSVEIPMPTELSARRHNIALLAVGLVIALSVAIFERLNDSAPEVTETVVKSNVQTIELPNVTAENASAQASGLAEAPASAPQAMARSVAVPAPKQAIIQQPAAPQQPAPQAAVRTTPAPVQVQAQKPAPAVTAAAVPADKPAVGAETNGVVHALRLEFDADSWVEVKDGSDKILTSRVHTAGSLVRVTGKAPLTVTIGNARVVRLFDNGKQINLERYTTADVAHVTLK